MDSACLHLTIHDKPPLTVNDEPLFFSVIKTAFSQRRKTLRNSLKKVHPDINDILENLKIDAGRRPETLCMEEFAALANKLHETGKLS